MDLPTGLLTPRAAQRRNVSQSLKGEGVSDTAIWDSEIYLHLERTADEDKKKGYVPAYYFKIRRREDDAVVGQCDLRRHNLI